MLFTHRFRRGANIPNTPQQQLTFHSAVPCRVADTRAGTRLAAGSTRNFTISSIACGVPSSAKAYVLNITAVPPGPLTYLSTWPAGQPQPVVSTLNSFDGRVVANAAIVPAGANGDISVFVSDASDVILDVAGYFTQAGGGTYLYLATPCRVADTRPGQNTSGGFGPPAVIGGTTRDFTIPSGGCAIPSAAQAYALNMTVVPSGPLGYLTTWAAGQSQPLVSTLNSYQGKVVANSAIVPTGISRAISVFVTNTTDLIIDVSGYFAPYVAP